MLERNSFAECVRRIVKPRLVECPVSSDSSRRNARAVRGFLLQLASLAALCVASPAAAQSPISPPSPPCGNVAGSTVTCTGNLAPGVAIGSGSGSAPGMFVASGSPYDTLNVNSLTAAITPATGNPGISFYSYGNIAINSDTGSFGITTSGDYASGILTLSGNLAQSNGGNVAVTSSGNIATTGFAAAGIWVDSFGVRSVSSVSNKGNISTSGDSASGINAFSVADLNLTNTGNISTTGQGAGGISANVWGSLDFPNYWAG